MFLSSVSRRMLNVVNSSRPPYHIALYSNSERPLASYSVFLGSICLTGFKLNQILNSLHWLVQYSHVVIFWYHLSRIFQV